MVWNKALHIFSGFLKAKAIKGANGEPYLECYMLLRCGSHAVFLHRFLASDPDRGLYDHPWSASVSLILCGSYIEKRLVSSNGVIWTKLRGLRAGMVNKIQDDDFHQVGLKNGVAAWAIFHHGPRVKSWSFAVAPRAKEIVEVAYGPSSHEPVHDVGPDEPWEIKAPRGRALAGRMPADYCYNER